MRRILCLLSMIAVIAPPALIVYAVINLLFFSGIPETPEERREHKFAAAIEEFSHGNESKVYDYLDAYYDHGEYADPPETPTKNLR